MRIASERELQIQASMLRPERVSSGSSCQSLDAVVIGRSHAALLMSNPGKALVSKNTAESEEEEEE